LSARALGCIARDPPREAAAVNGSVGILESIQERAGRRASTSTRAGPFSQAGQGALVAPGDVASRLVVEEKALECVLAPLWNGRHS
jgi:hypothetical protein